MFIYCICTQYLVGAPFALITASIWRGMEVISLWHCWGGMKPRFLWQWPSAHLHIFGLLFPILHLTIPNIFYGVQVRRLCWPIKHSNTMVIEPAFGIFGSVGRCRILLENEISIFKKLVSRRKTWSALKCLGKRVQWRWFSKNTMDQHQQMTLHPKSSQTVET